MKIVEKIYTVEGDENSEPAGFIAVTEKDGLYGLTDDAGNVLAEFIYDNMTVAGPGYFMTYKGGKLGFLILGMSGIADTGCVFDRADVHENYIIMYKRNEVYCYITSLDELTGPFDNVCRIDERFIEVYDDEGRQVIDVFEGTVVSEGEDYCAERIFNTEYGYVIYETGDEDSRLVFTDDYSDEAEEVYFDELVSVIYGPGIDPVCESFIASVDEEFVMFSADGRELPAGSGRCASVEMTLSAGDEDKMNIAGVSHFDILQMPSDFNI